MIVEYNRPMTVNRDMEDLPSIGVVGTGSYVPEFISSNRSLASILKLKVGEDWIVKNTGIRERRVAAPQEATSDLATIASERALLAAEVASSDLDLVVVATSSPDQMLPATACTVQANIGAIRAAAFDLNAACAGFVYALKVVWGAMRGDPGIKTALVVGADTYTRIVDYKDRSTVVLFGDGAGATVLARTSDGYGILASCLGANGTEAHLVQVPAGGSRKPASAESVAGREHFIRMKGDAVREFLKRHFAVAVRDTLLSTGLSLDNIDLIVPHQANGVILADCAKDLCIPQEKLCFTVERYGNTGAASVPITLDDAVRAGRVEPGSMILLVGFGAGMTWGGVLMRWVNHSD